MDIDFKLHLSAHAVYLVLKYVYNITSEEQVPDKLRSAHKLPKFD